MDLKERIKRLEELMGENAERKKEYEALKSKKRTIIDQMILILVSLLSVGLSHL